LGKGLQEETEKRELFIHSPWSSDPGGSEKPGKNDAGSKTMSSEE